MKSRISNVSYISLLHTALVENRPASHWPLPNYSRQPALCLYLNVNHCKCVSIEHSGHWPHCKRQNSALCGMGRGQHSRIMSQTAFIYHRFWANFVSLSLPAVRCNAPKKLPLVTFLHYHPVKFMQCSVPSAWTEQSTSQLNLSED